jgi:glutamate synthase (ferredoxin)
MRHALRKQAVCLTRAARALQEAYEAYRAHFDASPAHVLRDCLELTPAGPPVPLEEVQLAGDILTRFCTGGMSLGAISRETHETIAIAMNRIGGALLPPCPCSYAHALCCGSTLGAIRTL